jgi:hypothetical protein
METGAGWVLVLMTMKAAVDTELTFAITTHYGCGGIVLPTTDQAVFVIRIDRATYFARCWPNEA